MVSIFWAGGGRPVGMMTRAAWSFSSLCGPSRPCAVERRERSLAVLVE
jgi:hypothetical protein